MYSNVAAPWTMNGRLAIFSGFVRGDVREDHDHPGLVCLDEDVANEAFGYRLADEFVFFRLQLGVILLAASWPVINTCILFSYQLGWSWVFGC